MDVLLPVLDDVAPDHDDGGSDMEIDSDDDGKRSEARGGGGGVADRSSLLQQSKSLPQGAQQHQQQRQQQQSRQRSDVGADSLEVPTIAVKGISAKAVEVADLEKHFHAHRPTRVNHDGKTWLVEFATLEARDRALKDLRNARVGFHVVTLSAFRGNMRTVSSKSYVDERERIADAEAEARRIIRARLLAAVRSRIVADRFQPLLEEAMHDWEQRCRDRDKRASATAGEAGSTSTSRTDVTVLSLGGDGGDGAEASALSNGAASGGFLGGSVVAALATPFRAPIVGAKRELQPAAELFLSSSFKVKEEKPVFAEPTTQEVAVNSEDEDEDAKATTTPVAAPILLKVRQQRPNHDTQLTCVMPQMEKEKSGKRKKAKTVAAVEPSAPESVAKSLADQPQLLEQYNATMYRRKVRAARV